MRLAEWFLLPVSVVLMVMITMRPGHAHAADGPIFGTVSDAGMIVLTDNPGNQELPQVVAGLPSTASPAAAEAAAPAVRAKGSRRFAAIILEASRQSHVAPELLRAVITVESGFNPLAVSKKGARGLMQLMPATARRFKAVNSLNPRENVLAGARYLRRLLDRFKGNVELALAAYNAGENAVIRAGYRIPAFAETRSYVPLVMAHYRRLLAGR